MSVYQAFSPQQPVQYTCPICLEKASTSDQETVAHAGQGEKHPVHTKCIKVWLQNRTSCPTCQINIDNRSLFSWEERCIRGLKHGAKYAVLGAIGSIAGGLIGGQLFAAPLRAMAAQGNSLLTLSKVKACTAMIGSMVFTQESNEEIGSKILVSAGLCLAGTAAIELITAAALPIIGEPLIAHAVVGALFTFTDKMLDQYM